MTMIGEELYFPRSVSRVNFFLKRDFFFCPVVTPCFSSKFSFFSSSKFSSLWTFSPPTFSPPTIPEQSLFSSFFFFFFSFLSCFVASHFSLLNNFFNCFFDNFTCPQSGSFKCSSISEGRVASKSFLSTAMFFLIKKKLILHCNFEFSVIIKKMHPDVQSKIEEERRERKRIAAQRIQYSERENNQDYESYEDIININHNQQNSMSSHHHHKQNYLVESVLNEEKLRLIEETHPHKISSKIGAENSSLSVSDQISMKFAREFLNRSYENDNPIATTKKMDRNTIELKDALYSSASKPKKPKTIEKSQRAKTPCIQQKNSRDETQKEPANYMKNLNKKYGRKTSPGPPSDLHKKGIHHVREIIPQKFTFKPEVHSELPSDIYPHRTVAVHQQQKENVVDRLYENKNEKIVWREKKKLELEQAELEACTFKPQINKSGGNQGYPMSVAPEDVPLCDRLYNEGMEKKRKLEIKKREAADAETHTFRPDISTSIKVLKGDKAFQKPIYERFPEEQRKKMENLEIIKSKYSDDDKYTFHPQINKTSSLLGKEKNEFIAANVTDRLVKNAAEKIYKNNKLIQDYESKLSSICTFTPAINPTSSADRDEVPKMALYSSKEINFIDRQVVMANEHKKKIEEQKELILQKECSFKPKINDVSKYLAESDSNRQKESEYDRFNRLSNKDHKKREVIREQLHSAYYSQFEYQPSINPISAHLAKNRSINELAYNKDAEIHLKNLQEEAVISEMKECSFKPALISNKQYVNVAAHYSEKNISESLKTEKLNKNLKIEHKKKQNEYEMMKDCSFKPITNRPPCQDEKENSITTTVKGLDSHLLRTDLQRRKDQEKKKAEEKLFHLEKFYDPAKHAEKTHSKPFSLSMGSQIKKQEKIKQYMEEEKRIYTFKPETNYMKNKKMLDKLVEEDKSQSLSQKNKSLFQKKNYKTLSLFPFLSPRGIERIFFNILVFSQSKIADNQTDPQTPPQAGPRQLTMRVTLFKQLQFPKPDMPQARHASSPTHPKSDTPPCTRPNLCIILVHNCKCGKTPLIPPFQCGNQFICLEYTKLSDYIHQF